MEAVRTSETSVDNYFTRQYLPEDNSEHHTGRRENLKSNDSELNNRSHSYQKNWDVSRHCPLYQDMPRSNIGFLSEGGCSLTAMHQIPICGMLVHQRSNLLLPLSVAILKADIKYFVLIFWVVTSCRLVGRYHRFGGTFGYTSRTS
jgi:hypothetical protein